MKKRIEKIKTKTKTKKKKDKHKYFYLSFSSILNLLCLINKIRCRALNLYLLLWTYLLREIKEK